MAGEEITRFAVNDTLGKDDFKPLNKIVEDCTNIKIQTVQFYFYTSGYNFYYDIKKNIDPVDISKTIIHIPCLAPNNDVRSLSFEFEGNNVLRGQCDVVNQASYRVTVQVITFGGKVV